MGVLFLGWVFYFLGGFGLGLRMYLGFGLEAIVGWVGVLLVCFRCGIGGFGFCLGGWFWVVVGFGVGLGWLWFVVYCFSFMFISC